MPIVQPTAQRLLKSLFPFTSIMKLSDVTSLLLPVPSNRQAEKLFHSPQSLLRKIEHIPSVNLQKLRFQKYVFLCLLTLTNAAVLYLALERRFFWMVSVLLIFSYSVDVIEITMIIFVFITRRTHQRTQKLPDTPENFVYLLPCYNESHAELVKSLTSLAAQKRLDEHNKATIIVCDGRFKGKGMLKTAAACLTEDIIEGPSRTVIPKAYTSWDGSTMDVEVVQGQFKGLPIFCIIKEENRGKRDSLILARSFVHSFNKNTPARIASADLSGQLTKFLVHASIRSVDYIVGIDADTRFDTECVFNLIQTVRESDSIIGVTGCILPDPNVSGFMSIPYLYQKAEYTMGQYRRRLRQDLTSKKVTCLPGCCQIFRVLESTCGDEILQQFGHYPKETDGLFRTIRSMMSEDRDHVCLVLRENANVQTRQCLSARAYTTVPESLSAFLKQRRRWTIGPITSDVLLTLRKSTGWFERAAALSSIFRVALYLSLYVAKYQCRKYHPHAQAIIYYLDWYRIMWDLSLVLHTGSIIDAMQYLVGFVLCIKFDSIVRCVIQLYCLYNLDDLRWGKAQQEQESTHVRDHSHVD